MPYLGFARSPPHGPVKTYELVLDELRRRGVSP